MVGMGYLEGSTEYAEFDKGHLSGWWSVQTVECVQEVGRVDDDQRGMAGERRENGGKWSSPQSSIHPPSIPRGAPSPVLATCRHPLLKRTLTSSGLIIACNHSV